MSKKRIIVGSVVILTACVLVVYNAVSVNRIAKRHNIDIASSVVASKNHKTTEQNNNKTKIKNKSVNKELGSDKNLDKNIAKNEKHINMYESSLASSSLPLSGITELAGISSEVNDKISNVFDTFSSVYLIKKHGNKIFIVADDAENIRHGIDFIEISANNGHQIKTTFGHTDKMKNSDNEIWEYEPVPENPRPVRHTVYDKKGDVEFVEIWNYDDNPIKYERKDGEGKVISLKKEIIENESDLRVENLFYDKDGNTKLNVTAVYEGADLKRFTYYDADNLNESVSIINEYNNGQKVKETLYSSDLKVKNIYESEYENGSKANIKVYNADNELQSEYLPLSE